MEGKFVCPKCQNSDPRYIGYDINNKPYCRKCISFSGRMVVSPNIINKGIELNLAYPLSPKQKEISNQVISSYLKNKPVLINAVTGAGKTELVYGVMELALKQGKQVGFAIPRKDVVIDLAPRIHSAFPKAKLAVVYGNHSDVIQGDIILLTTHQLYRYTNYFDLLIVDEIDAFPFKGNETLYAFLKKALKGVLVMMSATLDNKTVSSFKKNGTVLYLNERYHHHKLPVPTYVKFLPIKLLSLISEMRKILKENKPLFVFVPTIQIGLKLSPLIKKIFPNGEFVSSETEEREKIIEDFKRGKYLYLITTSILERGVTLKNLQVIVYQADHDLFTAEGLIQIAGRVGRKADAYDGKCIFIGERKNESISRTIETIERINAKARL